MFSKKKSSHSEYTEGDLITAAIVGPEHAETKLKELAGRLTGLKTSNRSAKLDQIVKRVQSEIDELLEKHARGGNTDETRLDACIAKVMADILQRELANFQWNVEERLNDDPATVFRDTVQAFIESERNKWEKGGSMFSEKKSSDDWVGVNVDKMKGDVRQRVVEFLTNFEIYLEHQGELEEWLKLIPSQLWEITDSVAYGGSQRFIAEHSLEKYSKIPRFPSGIKGHQLLEVLAFLLKVNWQRGYL